MANVSGGIMTIKEKGISLRQCAGAGWSREDIPVCILRWMNWYGSSIVAKARFRWIVLYPLPGSVVYHLHEYILHEEQGYVRQNCS
jgi:hypothetical protein